MYCANLFVARLTSLEPNAVGHEVERRNGILQRMLKSIDLEHPPLIEPPFTCDYVSILPIKPFKGEMEWALYCLLDTLTAIISTP